MLEKTNVFTEVFGIWHDGLLGIISSFSRVSSPVTQGAGMRLTLAEADNFVAHSLSNKMGLELQRYLLVPKGNHPYLESWNCLEPF